MGKKKGGAAAEAAATVAATKKKGGRGISGSASLLLPHLAMAVRAEEVARKQAELVPRRGRNERRESRGVAAMAMEAKDECEQMRNYRHSTAT